MNAALDLLRLYSEWGVDVAVGDTPLDLRRAYLTPLPAASRPAPEPTARQYPNTQAHSAPPPTHAQPPAQQAPTLQRRRLQTQPDAPPILPQECIELAQAAAMQATTPEALHAAMQGFTACSLHKTAMHTLFPQGPRGAPLMIIGESPDADEDRSGTVFAGLNGDLLAQMLSPIGLKRDDLLLATTLPWRPPGGRPPTDTELQVCKPFLQRAITLLAPQRLLLCGRLPARLLTGSTTPLPRQAWHPLTLGANTAPLPAMVIRNPLQLRASPTARKDIWQTLLVVAQTLQLNS